MSFILLGILNSQIDAAGGAAYELLETQILTADAASVTFTGLDTLAAGFKHLQIRAVGRSNRVATQDALLVQLNGNTGSIYARHELRGDGTSVTSSATTSTTSMQAMVLPGTTDLATSGFDAAVIDLLDFSSTTKNTTMRALNGKAGDIKAIRLFSGLFANTSAITSISLATGVGQIVAGSRFSLYGIRGE